MTTVNVEARVASPIGTLRLIANASGLIGLYMPRHVREPAASELATDEPCEPSHPVLRETAKQLAEYFAGTRQVFDLPLAASGTEFQRRVWQALCTIDFGRTWSYAELARAIDQPNASRAVGAANGRNPISIVVPCHRVIGSNGSLTGYGGGEWNKRWLLDHEAVVAGRALPFAR
ncbi:methylated-DNA--[protein]-cysteine S-methyltransferase [Nannocystaceae bacterium ST9]